MSEVIGLTPQYGSSGGNGPFKTQVQNVNANTTTTVVPPENIFAALVCFTDGNVTHFTLGTCTFIVTLGSSVTANFSYAYYTGSIQATLTSSSLVLTCKEEFDIETAKYAITWLING